MVNFGIRSANHGPGIRTLPVLTASETRALEQKALGALKIPANSLMEKAGEALATAAAGELGAVRGKKILLLLGKGNNAGDALEAGRLCSKAGAKVEALGLFPDKDFSPDAKKMKSRFRGLRFLSPDHGPRTTNQEPSFGSYDLLIDGIFGTGSRPGLPEPVARLVNRVNRSGRPVLAVDLPTGLDADRGVIPGNPVIQASATVCLAAPKMGILGPGALNACGKIRVAGIGIPGDLLAEASPKLRWMLSPPGLPHRPREFHKGMAGRVGVVGGSPALAGAAVLAAKAAFRSGAGLTFLYHPRATTPWTASRLLGEIPFPVGGTTTETFREEHAPSVLKELEGKDAAALGPGLGPDLETRAFTRKIIEGLGPVPLVLDADGLGAYAGNLGELKGRRGPTLLSPHPGEMGRLLGISSAEVQADRLASLNRAVFESACHVILKGALTLVAGPGTPVYVNPTGDSGLSKGGSGDLLTGLLAGFLAQGMETLDAALAGVYIHGLAAEIASFRGHPRSTAPEDILAALGEAFKTSLAPC